MASVEIKIKVSTTGTVGGWWACVDDQDATFQNGSAKLQVEEGAEHLFYYWLVGAQGAKIDFSITQGNDTRLKGSDAIPAGYSKLGNARFFKTNPAS